MRSATLLLHLLRLCLLCLLCAAQPACGKAVESADEDQGASGDAGPDDGGGDDGQDDGDDDGGDDADDDGGEPDAGPPADGLIIASSSTFTDETGTRRESSFARAFFGDHQTESCEVQLEEARCRVLACTPRSAATPLPEAGLIVIQIDTVDMIELTPGKGGAYNAYGAQAELFPDGADLAVFAAGADVPAFDVDLVAPSSVGMVGAPTSATSIVASAAAGHQLDWGGVEASDTVHVVLSALPDDEQVSRRIDCRVPAGVATLTLSSQALSLMPPGDLQFDARVETSAEVTAGDHAVTFTASVVARDGDDDTFNYTAGTLTLEP